MSVLGHPTHLGLCPREHRACGKSPSGWRAVPTAERPLEESLRSACVVNIETARALAFVKFDDGVAISDCAIYPELLRLWKPGVRNASIDWLYATSAPRRFMTVLGELELPKDWREFRLPRAMHGWLHELLGRQDRDGKLSGPERREATALAKLVDMLSLMRLRAELATKNRS